MIMIMILHHLSCICRKIFCIAYMHHIFSQILHILLHILPQKVPHILRKFSGINQHSLILEEQLSVGGEAGGVSSGTVR